jgi:FixJ family two-component response regulator
MLAMTTDKVPVISIVDDDTSVRVAMTNLVRSLGFAARSFDSAEEYLKSGERHETSCIVSDIQMPGTNGLEMQSRLVAQNDRTPIIFITAFPQPNIRRRALEAGAVCFLTKPFDGETLIGCIEEALRARDSGRADV